MNQGGPRPWQHPKARDSRGRAEKPPQFHASALHQGRAEEKEATNTAICLLVLSSLLMPHLVITPNCRILFKHRAPQAGGEVPWDISVMEQFSAAFGQSNAAGLVMLASRRGNRALWSVEMAFWREFVDLFLFAFSHQGGQGAISLPPGRAEELVLQIPGTPGAEYATVEFFHNVWAELVGYAATAAGNDPKGWLQRVNPAFHMLGKVTLHLAENKRTPDRPFAFLATYTHRLSAGETPVHLPFSRALQEYAGARNMAALKSLLEPLQLAGERSKWMLAQLDSKSIFQSQAWHPTQAYQFLKEIPVFESCGIAVRIPNWWKSRSASGVKVSVAIGGGTPSTMGLAALLDFKVGPTLDGQSLTHEEWLEIMQGESGLVSLRGQWVEVDKAKLQEALKHWNTVKSNLGSDGVSFLDGMRMLAGVKLGKSEVDDESEREWSQFSAGEWLKQTIDSLREPTTGTDVIVQQRLKATLRPYQEKGLAWLTSMTDLRLGACLADDMGLGKTIQVIALLLRNKFSKKSTNSNTAPSLLVAPASLLANWKQEIQKFAPDLNFLVLHPSETPVAGWKDAASAALLMTGKDLVLTTYSMTLRTAWMSQHAWHFLILDEAQAIKNPSSKQTQAVKRLPAYSRVAMTGTPVENNLGDLWSLYDFLNPGLLGKSAEFSRYIKGMGKDGAADYSPLRKLIQPYLLRRMKTDKSIIADLPDKTEIASWCLLAPKQAALYQKSVKDLAKQLETLTGIERRGLVLTALMKFKQICNHPSQWLRDDDYEPEDSGKFDRLAELCEEIASRQEKVLVFTQFREMTEPLCAFLRRVFGRPGLVLHGDVAVKERQKLVSEFQREDGPPFFVLSLKAGGTGLTLTNANHVIHFDRWWNPAVENQATDRAFRIGQKRNVMVHKFVCRGTIEERIHQLIHEKTDVANSVIDATGGAGKMLMEMSNDELLKFVSLDISSVAET
jgi:SNF2 family DNA or RNA helicase